MSGDAITLDRFLTDEESRRPREEQGLVDLLKELAGAGRVIARDVGRAGLVGLLGYAGGTNPTGEAQKKLDIAANDTLIDAVERSGVVASLVSEEMEDGKIMATGGGARFILCTDPLDGSSNSDINGTVGTIFGIYLRKRSGPCAAVLEEIQDDARLVCAGYVMYGPATILVTTRGDGVNGFTLDPDRNAFILTHPKMVCPLRGSYYSANLGREQGWDPNVRRFVERLVAGDRSADRPHSLRYVGALVADLHRGLLEGGIFFYPGDAKNPDGKLRLLYECAPLAFVTEQAGGRASTGRQRILDVRPASLHQRVPLAIGSRDDVALYDRMLAGEDVGCTAGH